MSKRIAIPIVVLTTVVFAPLAPPATAAQTTNDITAMSVEFARYETQFGTTYCTYRAVVAFTHKGPVQVEVYARNASDPGFTDRSGDFAGSGSNIYETTVWMPYGETASVGSILGQYKQKGPNTSEFVVLDAYEFPGTTTCS